MVDFFASDIAHDMLLHVLFLVANAALFNVNEGVVFTFTCAFVHHFCFIVNRYSFIGCNHSCKINVFIRVCAYFKCACSNSMNVRRDCGMVRVF